MTDTKMWDHLPNAALIDAAVAAAPHYNPADREGGWYAARSEARNAALRVIWVSDREDDVLNSAWDAVWRASEHNGAARWNAATSIVALVAWDDMPAYIAMSNDELNALRAIADGTDVAHKAFCALIYKDITA